MVEEKNRREGKGSFELVAGGDDTRFLVLTVGQVRERTKFSITGRNVTTNTHILSPTRKQLAKIFLCLLGDSTAWQPLHTFIRGHS